MIDKALERAIPFGFLIGVGALVGAAFPAETRAATKTAMRKGFRVAEWLRGAGAEAYEKGQDVFVEARSEYDQLVREAQREAERGRLRIVSEPQPRRRTRRASSNGDHAARPRARRTSGRETSTESR
jgi:hypothetical protein